jgi:YebC/PmpR family DNA-binding regulatory protein
MRRGAIGIEGCDMACKIGRKGEKVEILLLRRKRVQLLDIKFGVGRVLARDLLFGGRHNDWRELKARKPANVISGSLGQCKDHGELEGNIRHRVGGFGDVGLRRLSSPPKRASCQGPRTEFLQHLQQHCFIPSARPMSTPLGRCFAALRSFENTTHGTCQRAAAPASRRHLSSSAPRWSGHSKWATIKHDKGKNDAAKSKLRVSLGKDISNAVKMGGADPNMNPRLALAIASAKKNSMPKAVIEAAIARGQGLSASGAALESVTLEAMLPPSIATVIECQTENKLRTLADLRLLVKDAGGQVSTVGYMFEKKGRVVFRKKDGVGLEEVLEPALEAGALDVVEDDEGRVVLYTEPAETKTTAEHLAGVLQVEIEEMEIIYDANEDTKVALDDTTSAEGLNVFLNKLEEVSGVQGVYMNWSKGAIDEELWNDLRSKVAV